MFDVIYIDSQGAPLTLASGLVDRQEACKVACAAAHERGVGRMVADSFTRAVEGRCLDTVLVVGSTPIPRAA